jgi:predicted permease
MEKMKKALCKRGFKIKEAEKFLSFFIYDLKNLWRNNLQLYSM